MANKEDLKDTHVTFRTSSNTHKAIKELAKRLNISKSKVIQNAINLQLANGKV